MARWLTRSLSDRSLADDVFQATFLVLAQSAEAGQAGAASEIGASRNHSLGGDCRRRGGASVASAAPPAALVSSTISLAATGAAVGTSLTAGTSTAIQLAGKELAAMSAASKATAFVMGVAGTLTVGGAILFGAMVDGISGPGPGAGSGDLTAVLATEEPGAGEAVAGPEPMLLALNDDDKVPGTEEKEDVPGQPAENDDAAPEMTETEDPADEPDETQAPESEEKDEDAPMKKEDTASEEITSAEDHSAEEGSEHPARKGSLVASFRQLSPQDEKVYEALEKETSLEFADNTLQEVSEFLLKNHKVRIRFDRQALEDAGIASESRIGIMISGLSLSDSLSLMLEDVGGIQLDYYVDRGGIKVTTPDKMQDKDDLRFYDLSGDREEGGIGNLAQAVESYARSIDEGLKNETNNSSVTSFGDSLAIRASLDTQKKIEEFIAGAFQLAEKRRAAGKPLPVVPPTPSNPLSVPTSAMRSAPPETNLKSEGVPDSVSLKIAKFRDLNAMDRNADQALEQTFELDCPDCTLAEFAEYLSATTSIPVRIDEVSLDTEDQKAAQIKVSDSGRNTLANSLHIVFETAVTGARLDDSVDRGVLFITLQKEMHHERERYYDLSGGDENLSLGQRVQVDLKSIDPEQVTTLSATGGDRFAITTSLIIHKKLETFLAEARE